MPKAVEDCVSKLHGTNKRTGKPYTKSEKYAICTAMHKKSGDAGVDLEKIAEKVANATYTYAKKLFENGKATSMSQAYDITQSKLAYCKYDYELLEMIIGD